ncbi:PREDICTED: phorbol ester/diacylglycerol-binding protein unc-13-like [Ceratosolen solmsi marchali]|uniref:Phorbol ester/diacylglycerol-binding protein unc-13-like n=1 Tax=Ceratosolen solmsi marchali TaxID=326594 RepID=A0AAJ7E048_9HYME|nr:PREDICTED: phorbol ester/diacylglycerol-binding protein unc-13-like [Ceratosolen solmsi marchali]
MSLLSIAVKKARYIGVQAQQFNTYVTLKLQNVKSTTITVKGANPCWEQDFLFETNEINIGLLVEVWCKGILWDRALGYYYLLLPAIPYSNENGFGEWVSLDSELEMKGGEVVGTKTPTGHTLLIDCRFELPFDAQNTNAIDLQQKLEMLNSTVDNEIGSEQGHRQLMYNIAHSGYSEDSDYTSDFNYPVDGQGANSSISQFCTAATQLETPQSSLETSRENSYDRDDQQVPTNVASSLTPAIFSDYSAKGLRYNEPYPGDDSCQRYMNYSGESSEPLFYNSRPKYYKEYREEDCYNDHYNYQVLKINNTRIYNDIQNSPNMAIKSIRKTGAH